MATVSCRANRATMALAYMSFREIEHSGTAAALIQWVKGGEGFAKYNHTGRSGGGGKLEADSTTPSSYRSKWFA